MIEEAETEFDARFRELAEETASRLAAWRGPGDEWLEEEFDRRALEAFRLQFEANLPYSRYCRALGIEADGVRRWQDIPPAPTAAFRSVDLCVGEAMSAEAVFRTSGTSRGPELRGTHYIRSTDLYLSAMLGPFRHFVLGDRPRARLLILHPGEGAETDSSLTWMLDRVEEQCAAPGSVRVKPSAVDELMSTALRALEAARDDGVPIVVLGTTLALDAWLESMEADRVPPLPLPADSTFMDTGGAKGRAGLDRRAVVDGLMRRFDLPESAFVNEFGMTELLSQRYGRGLEPLLEGPPWLRTRALDPVTLAEVPAGDIGLLCHYDLANLGSVVAVLTEDRGRVVEGEVQWLGRTPGAVPRGCSLATAELLAAQP